MKLTICELFAGIGGFRYGFSKASPLWKTVWFSQWEPGTKKQWAHACYVQHFGDIDAQTNVDIALVPKHTIPTHTLLVGGFPCQDYSVVRPANEAKGIEGIKGVLWWQIYDTLRTKMPPFVLLENVDRLLKSPAKQRGRDFGIILKCFDKLGYSVLWRVINAADYGCAQKRKRVFLFAFRNYTKYANMLKTPQEALETKGLFAKAFPIKSASCYTETTFGEHDLPTISETFTYMFENAGYMHNGTIVTAKVEPQQEPAKTLRSVLEHDVPEEYYIAEKEKQFKYYKGAKEKPRTAKDGHCYTYKEGAIPFPDILDIPARTMLTSEGTVGRCSHVIQDPQTGRLRLLTPCEAERLQGFADGWTETGMPKRMRYFCVGNALVVDLVERMAKELLPIIEEE